MRVGIIGGGRIVQRKYIPILKSDIKLIYDPIPEAVKELVEIREKEKLNYIIMGREDQWIDSYKVVGPLDVVVIASPTGMHLKSLQMLFHYWKGPVIIEKPLATNYNEAQKIYDGEDMWPTSVKIHPVFQNRMNASVQFLKQLLETQSLGEILHVDAFLGWRRNNEYFDKHPWRMIKEQGGGIGDHLAHIYDLFRYLIGGFHSRVILRGLPHFGEGENRTAPDTAFMSGRFFTGFNTSFSIFGSNAVGPRDLGTRLTVYGTKGYVELSGFFWNVVRCETKKAPDEIAEILLQQSIEENQSEDPLIGHKKFLKETFGRITAGLGPIVSREEALFTIEKVEGALK